MFNKKYTITFCRCGQQTGTRELNTSALNSAENKIIGAGQVWGMKQ